MNRTSNLIIFLTIALLFSLHVSQPQPVFAYGGGGGGGGGGGSGGGGGGSGSPSAYNPCGLAVENDMLFMSHSAWNHIKAYDLDGTLLYSVGEFGIKDGFLIKPYGLAVHENMLYVADTGNYRIQVFTTAGEFMFSFGEKGYTAGKFQKPYDLAIYQNMIFVTDPINKNTQVFDLSGNFISSFVPSHANLKYPSEIAISEDRIFLTDTTRAGIFIYDLDGGPIAEFGSKDDGEKELKKSNDLLIYGNNLLVVRGENNRIQVFDLEGNYLRMFGEFVPENPNKSVEKNEAPNSIAYSNNKFYVGYTGACNVKTYDATEIGIPDWIKTNAGWWADGQIPDSAFIDGIEYLIKQEVIVVQNFYEIQLENDSTIPLWVKTNAGWWADGQIPDSAFIDGIEYLIKHGIIKIDLTMEPKPAY